MNVGQNTPSQYRHPVREGQFAATGSSQGRTLELIADQMGEKVGTEKLMNLQTP